MTENSTLSTDIQILPIMSTSVNVMTNMYTSHALHIPSNALTVCKQDDERKFQLIDSLKMVDIDYDGLTQLRT